MAMASNNVLFIVETKQSAVIERRGVANGDGREAFSETMEVRLWPRRYFGPTSIKTVTVAC